jgi:hypothetical protein
LVNLEKKGSNLSKMQVLLKIRQNELMGKTDENKEDG